MNVEEPEAVQCARVARNKKSNDGFARLSPMFARAPLDWLNFFLADVRGGLGAYVGVFLLTQAHWNQATIGAVLTVSGLIGITIHAPIGALIDATHHKRGLIIVGTCADFSSRPQRRHSDGGRRSNFRADGSRHHARNDSATGSASSTGSKRSLRPGWKHFHSRSSWVGWLGFLAASRLLPCSVFCGSDDPCRALDPGPRHRPRPRTRFCTQQRD
jgi:hypothetical protein